MTYLVLDTSTRYGAVGLWHDGRLVRSSTWYSENNHTGELMPSIEALLASAGVVPRKLDGIVVAHGPGGFSALRAGLGVAKGLAFARGIPVLGVSTLEATAYPHRGLGLPVCAVLEAGRGFVAWARFASTPAGWRRRTPDRVTPVDDLLAGRGRHVLFCGEAIAAYGQRLRAELGPRAHLFEEPAPLPRLMGLAELGVARLAEDGPHPATALRPHYLRKPAIGRPARQAPVAP